MKPESFASHNPAGITVVVVDDDSLMRTLVGRTLKAEGYDVWTVDGSQEARALMRKLGDKVAVLLTDVAMPDGAGSDLAAEIRRTHPRTRIVYMSRYSPAELSSVPPVLQHEPPRHVIQHRIAPARQGVEEPLPGDGVA